MSVCMFVCVHAKQMSLCTHVRLPVDVHCICVHVHTHIFLEGCRNLGFTDLGWQPQEFHVEPLPHLHCFQLALGNQPGVPGPPGFCAFKEFVGVGGVPCLVRDCHA